MNRDSESFQSVCERAAERWDVPALAVGIAVHGRTETYAVGCDADTRFRIASITKPMTAMLALTLLDLDEPTGVWPADVRVRHLLSHTSGFDCELADRDNAKHGGGDHALDACVDELGSVRRLVGVDDIWSYANTGYWLAGWLAARRADATYEDALEQVVLRPAGLEATSFDEPDLGGTGADAADGPYPRSRRPSGGLVSTLRDLLRFGSFQLASPTGARMRVVAGLPVAGVYGLGLGGDRVGGVDVWGHGGSYGGFESSLLTVPGRGGVFVGLTNSSLGSKALAEVEDAFFELAVGARRARPRPLETSHSELQPFAAVYEQSDGRYEVEAAGNELVLRVDDGEHRARKIGDVTFWIPSGPRVDERFDFPRAGFGRFGSRLAVRLR